MIEYIFNINNIKALILTLIIEILVIFILREKKPVIYITCFITNIITNLTFNSVTPLLPFNNYQIYIILFEILIVIVEAIVYLIVTKKFIKSIIYSFAANTLSYILGMILMIVIY